METRKGREKDERTLPFDMPERMRTSPSCLSFLYSWPNPTVSSTAQSNFWLSASYDLYGGKSRRLKHVCDLGNCCSSPDFSMVKRRGPSLPWRSLKPLTGIREVPVANCNRRDFCSESQLRIHYRTEGQMTIWEVWSIVLWLTFQKCWITGSFSS